jgi:hypothetical protein
MGNYLVCAELHNEHLNKNKKLIKDNNDLKNKILGFERIIKEKTNQLEINKVNTFEIKKELNILKIENMNLITKNEELDNKLQNLNKHTDKILSSFKTINGILDNYE